MMTELKGTFCGLFLQYRFTYLVFWLILVFFISATFIIVFFIDGIYSVITLSAPLYILSIIMPWLLISQKNKYLTVYHLVKSSVSRLGVYIGIGLFFLFTSIINVLIVQAIKGVFGLIFTYENGTVSYVKGDSSYILTDIISYSSIQTSIWQELIVDFTIVMFLTVVSVVFATIFNRFGKVVGYSIVGSIVILFIIVMSTGTANETIVKTVSFIVDRAGFYYAYIVILLSIFIFCFNYIFLRKLVVK